MTEESSKIMSGTYMGLKNEESQAQMYRSNKPKLLPKLKTE